MSKNCCISVASRSATRLSANGVSSSAPSSRNTYAIENPGGVLNSIWMKSVPASMGFATGFEEPWTSTGFVLDILLQRHRDTEAAKTFLTRLLGEYLIPEVIHTDRLCSYGAAVREIPILEEVDHQQLISTARCNNIIEQEHRSTRRHERQQQSFKRRKRAQEFLSLHARVTNLHHHSRNSVTAVNRKSNRNQAFQTWLG